MLVIALRSIPMGPPPPGGLGVGFGPAPVIVQFDFHFHHEDNKHDCINDSIISKGIVWKCMTLFSYNIPLLLGTGGVWKKKRKKIIIIS